MLAVRTANGEDLDAILALASAAGPGMTTLKPDRAALRERLRVAADSFAGALPPAAADYLFVLEDLQTKRVLGVAAIKGAAGHDAPFYNYRISTSVHASPQAGRVRRVQSLHLSHDLSGSSELCSLYLHPDARRGGGGRLLSKSRLLFIAQFPALFAAKVFAEMRGYQDETGSSPFWEAVGRPFFDMDFHEADDLCGQGDRLFIEQLVPRLPLYTHLLGAAAGAAIGQTHPDTVPARRLLEQEGLHFDGYVDIFDGGPVLQANVRDLRAVRDSRLLPARQGQVDDGLRCLIATTDKQRFRAIAAPADPQASAACLAPDALAALGCEEAAMVRVMPMAAPAAACACDA